MIYLREYVLEEGSTLPRLNRFGDYPSMMNQCVPYWMRRVFPVRDSKRFAVTLTASRFLILALGAISGDVLANPGSSQVRAIFDEGLYWAGTPPEVDRVLSRVKKAGFNVYIPCVWHGSGAAWKSSVAPVSRSEVMVAQRDAFGVFLAAAHRAGIKVVPCFTLALRQGELRPEFTAKSHPDGYFNVQNKAFRRFARDMVLDFVRRYEIDGLNLDYVRAGQVCSDDDCKRSYFDATGRNLKVDLATYRINSSAFDALVNWQRVAVKDLVESISIGARKVRPDLLITVDAAPWFSGYMIQGQDSLAWSETGTVDLVFSMNYQPQIDWPAMRELQRGLRHPERLVVMVGNYDGEPPVRPTPRSGSEVARLVHEAELYNPAGHYAMYIYSLMTEEQVGRLASRPRRLITAPEL